jgi:hypothetical protein
MATATHTLTEQEPDRKVTEQTETQTETPAAAERAGKAWAAHLYACYDALHAFFKGMLTFPATEFLPSFPLNGGAGNADGLAKSWQIIPPTRKRRPGENVQEYHGLIVVNGEERVILNPDERTYTLLMAPILYDDAAERAKGLEAKPRDTRAILQDMLYAVCGASAHVSSNSGNPQGYVLNRTFQNIAGRVGFRKGLDGKPVSNDAKEGSWRDAVPDEGLAKQLDQIAASLPQPPAELNVLRYEMDETARGSALNVYGCPFRPENPNRNQEDDTTCASSLLRAASTVYGGRNPEDGSEVKGAFTRPRCVAHDVEVVMIAESPRTVARLKRLASAAETAAGATSNEPDTPGKTGQTETETDSSQTETAEPAPEPITAREVMAQTGGKGRKAKQ